MLPSVPHITSASLTVLFHLFVIIIIVVIIMLVIAEI